MQDPTLCVQILPSSGAGRTTHSRNHPTYLLRISFLLLIAWLHENHWEHIFPVRSTYHCFSGKMIQAYPGVTKLKKALRRGNGLNNINFLPFEYLTLQTY